jgi:hypothetical protein
MPMHKNVKLHPSTTPARKATRPPPVRVTNKPPHAAMVSKTVRTRWLDREWISSCLRNMGKSPKISIEKRVSQKTCVVDGSLDASTADAIIAELVDMEVGNLHACVSSVCRSSQYTLTVCLDHRYSQRKPHLSRATKCLKPKWNHSSWIVLVTSE